MAILGGGGSSKRPGFRAGGAGGYAGPDARMSAGNLPAMANLTISGYHHSQCRASGGKLYFLSKKNPGRRAPGVNRPGGDGGVETSKCDGGPCIGGAELKKRRVAVGSAGGVPSFIAKSFPTTMSGGGGALVCLGGRLNVHCVVFALAGKSPGSKWGGGSVGIHFFSGGCGSGQHFHSFYGVHCFHLWDLLGNRGENRPAIPSPQKILVGLFPDYEFVVDPNLGHGGGFWCWIRVMGL